MWRQRCMPTTGLDEARLANVAAAFLLVHPLVVADLAEEIHEAGESLVLVGEQAVVRLPLQTRILDEQRVLVLRVVLEVGVEPIAPRGRRT